MSYVLGKNILAEIATAESDVADKLKSKIENVKFTIVDGHVVDEKWYIDGLLGRVDGPAIIEYDDDGRKKCVYYCSGGKYDKKDKPAYIGYFSDGNISELAWFENGLRHRVDGPARVKFYNESLDVGTGDVFCEEWYTFGVLSRTDGGPAKVFFWQTGVIKSSEWFVDGVALS